MKNLHTIVLAIALATSFSSCSWLFPVESDPTDTKNPTPQSTEYYPLAVGNSWKYVPMDGIQTLVVSELHTRVQSMRTENSVETYTMVDSLVNGTSSYVNTYFIVKEGSIYYKSEDNITTRLLWTLNFADSTAKPGDDFYGFVQSRPATITVPAGTFSNNVQIFFPAAAYDGLPILVFTKGVGLTQIRPYGIPMDLAKAVVNGQVFGK